MENIIKTFQYNGQDALILPLKVGALALLNEWLSDIAKQLTLTEKLEKHLFIVADEIFTNCMQYAYPENAETTAELTVEIAYNTHTSHLILKFSDRGVPFNPLEAQEPNIHASLEERTVGGLGIFLVKKLMDSVEYTHENGQNVLILQKNIAANPLFEE